MYTNELYHHGIVGQRWGIRRYQNLDGTLTSAGRERYGGHAEKVNSNKLKRQVNRNLYLNRNMKNLNRLNSQGKHHSKVFDSFNYYTLDKRGKFVDNLIEKYSEAVLKDMGYEPTKAAVEYLASQPWFYAPYSYAANAYKKNPGDRGQLKVF